MTAKIQTTENLKIEYVPLSSLRHPEKNPRTWTKEATEQLKESIKRFGVTDPLIINKAPGRAYLDQLKEEQRLKDGLASAARDAYDPLTRLNNRLEELGRMETLSAANGNQNAAQDAALMRRKAMGEFVSAMGGDVIDPYKERARLVGGIGGGAFGGEAKDIRETQMLMQGGFLNSMTGGAVIQSIFQKVAGQLDVRGSKLAGTVAGGDIAAVRAESRQNIGQAMFRQTQRITQLLEEICRQNMFGAPMTIA